MPAPAAQRHHDRPGTDVAVRLGQQRLQIGRAPVAQRGIVFVAQLVQRQGLQTVAVRRGTPARRQDGRRVAAGPVQHGGHSQRQMLAQALAGRLLDRRLQMQFAHAVAQRQQEVLAVLAFPQFGFRGLARRHVEKERHHPVRPVLARPGFVPGLLGRGNGELELGGFAGLHDARESVHDLSGHARNHLAQRMPQRVPFLHAALPLEGRVDFQEPEIDDAAVRVAQGFAEEEGFLHALEHGPPPLAALPQRRLRQVAFDGQGGAARHQRDRVDVVCGRRADGAVVVGKHPQQPAVGRLDRRGPAGPQAVRQRQVAPVRPAGTGRDVLHVYRTPAIGRGAPGRHGRPDGRAVHRRVVGLGQAGRRAMQQADPGLVHQRDRRPQFHAGLRLDGVQHVFEHLRQRHPGGNALQHDAFVFQAGKRVRPGKRDSVLLCQHLGPLTRTTVLRGPARCRNAR